MDLEDMLRDGYTAEELRKEFEDELKEAQESIEAEKKHPVWDYDEDDIEDARECLIDDLLDYVMALGILDEEDRDDEDLYDGIEKEFIKCEQEIKEFADLFNSMKIVKNEERHIDPDTIIKTFIATL